MGKRRVEKGVPGMELLVCRNPKAAKQFDIEERIECGMILKGSEVKSLRLRQGDLDGAFAAVDREELWLHKMHIPLYEQAGPYNNHEPRRSRKLLAHRREIEKLRGRLTMQGYTLVPLQVYFKNGVAKVELGLAKGKKKGDQRESIKQKQDLREARAAMERSRR